MSVIIIENNGSGLLRTSSEVIDDSLSEEEQHSEREGVDFVEIVNSSIDGKKKFLCSYEGCTKRFAKVSKLTRHERTHTGEVMKAQYIMISRIIR